LQFQFVIFIHIVVAVVVVGGGVDASPVISLVLFVLSFSFHYFVLG
jgi:hypothetical protein